MNYKCIRHFRDVIFSSGDISSYLPAPDRVTLFTPHLFTLLTSMCQCRLGQWTFVVLKYRRQLVGGDLPERGPG
ncbi:hypothetical protein Bpfe_019121 [Biomphalaria pfeifferi]|uniref:Uncharacterized protein n=1 Tax=Biomphalaria pfeifferi TaxID=112525 RepID=A0AAD8F4L9_BIOPF|nr:hypothetical protein Bpfe_019121 [Biomphalaria pfeifferi]